MSELLVERWEGRADKECGEHRTLGRRAWCFACSEYCSPLTFCRGCEMPTLRAKNERLRAALKEIAEQDMVTTGTKDGTWYVRPMTASDAADIARQAITQAESTNGE